MREREKKERYREEDEEVKKKGEKWRREAVLKDAHERQRTYSFRAGIGIVFVWDLETLTGVGEPDSKPLLSSLLEAN